MSVTTTPESDWAPPVDHRVVELVAGIEAHLDELQAIPFSSLNEPTQQALVEALPGLAVRSDATITALLGRADAGCMAQRRRYRNLAQLLMAKTNIAGREARTRIRLAKRLRDFPEFAAEHERGELTTDHLEKIRRGLDNCRTHGLLRRDQELLVEAARTCSFKDFERACDYWKIAADPDGDEPKAQLATTHVRARRRADGMSKGPSCSIRSRDRCSSLPGRTGYSGWPAGPMRPASRSTSVCSGCSPSCSSSWRAPPGPMAPNPTRCSIS